VLHPPRGRVPHRISRGKDGRFGVRSGSLGRSLGGIALNPYRVVSLGDDPLTGALHVRSGQIPCSEIRAHAAHRREFPAGTLGSTTGRVDWGSVIARASRCSKKGVLAGVCQQIRRRSPALVPRDSRQVRTYSIASWSCCLLRIGCQTFGGAGGDTETTRGPTRRLRAGGQPRRRTVRRGPKTPAGVSGLATPKAVAVVC
jgi:hypothetical protein